MRPCRAAIDSDVAGSDPMSCSHCPAKSPESSAASRGPGAAADRELRTRFRDGDADAVRTIYRAHGRAVFSVAYRILRDRGLAEDATQQAFLNAWRAAHNFDTRRDVGPWLAVIAQRAAIDVYRRETARVADPLDSVPAGDPALSVEPATAALHDTWEIRRAVEELPENEREVVRMQHFEELTHPEIADRLGIAIGTVKSRSFRAHKRLATLTAG
jgi:RNA polymerase sigma factor (sigma-70 family)